MVTEGGEDEKDNIFGRVGRIVCINELLGFNGENVE